MGVDHATLEVEIKHSGLGNVTDGESHNTCTSVHCSIHKEILQVSIPFCLLAFCLLKFELCYFAYSTFSLTLIDLFSIHSYTDI